jgi:putative membrane protein
MKQMNDESIHTSLPTLPIGDVTNLLTSPPAPPPIQGDPYHPVGVVEIETLPMPDDPPQLPDAGWRPASQTSWLSMLLVVVGAMAIATATTAYLISRGFDAYRSVSSVHWLLGSTYLTALVVAVVCIAFVVFRSARRYQRLREVTELQELARQCESLPTSVSGSDIRNRIEDYLSQIRLEDDHKTREQIQSLRRHYVDSPKDPRQDLRDLDRYLLQRLDRRVNDIIDRKSAQVAWGTAFASHLIDPIIVLLQAVAMVDRIATLYAGRPGVMGTLRLLRRGVASVAFAEVAQQATELATTLTMGKVASKLGGRVAEGMANGLLMIRFGDAVRAHCRPIPLPPPSLASQATRLIGLLGPSLLSKTSDRSESPILESGTMSPTRP